MTFNYRILSVVALFCSGTALSMKTESLVLLDTQKQMLTDEKKQIFKVIVDNNQLLDRTVLHIKKLVADNEEWKSILDSKDHVATLLDYVRDHREIVAAFLGTSGAIEWGKEYIERCSEAKKNLNDVLIYAALLMVNQLLWPDQDLEIAKAILGMGVKVRVIDKDNSAEDNFGCAALIRAVLRKKMNFVQLLLDNGASTEIKDPWDGRTAIMEASRYGYNEMVNFLIARNADVNATDFSGNTALIQAACQTHVETVQKLIAAGAQVNAKNLHGETALSKMQHSAPQSDNFEKYAVIIQLLQNTDPAS